MVLRTSESKETSTGEKRAKGTLSPTPSPRGGEGGRGVERVGAPFLSSAFTESPTPAPALFPGGAPLPCAENARPSHSRDRGSRSPDAGFDGSPPGAVRCHFSTS